ncbi:hypothetical protein BKA61DRAFT_571318 [Leptodontidium sp. MPI-SDFR-AT-0119]|nr:hypothetical protein BKA61DRAFT_571318 [Leptodontidium sp. MPI-SDFR-AT-0119]
MSDPQPQSKSSSSPSPTMSTTPFQPLDTGKPQTPDNTTITKTDYRIPTPPDLHTVSRCVSDLILSASLAMKLASYITHPKSLSLSLSSLLITRQKNKEKKLALSGQMAMEKEGDLFAAAGGGENRSRAFMMEVARCEGVKECLEYACSASLLSSESRIRENIVEPLSHALAHEKTPRYAELTTEAEDVLKTTNLAIKEWAELLKEQVEIANFRLAAVPAGGEEWDGDYEEFAIVKKEARWEFARGLGL